MTLFLFFEERNVHKSLSISEKVFCLLIKINKLTLYGWRSIIKSFETFSKSKVFFLMCDWQDKVIKTLETILN